MAVIKVKDLLRVMRHAPGREPEETARLYF
jgi:hypothetical protein